MKSKTYICIWLLIPVILFSSCGGISGATSAPPVDLPAPITGRIEISEPDGNGNVTITGSAGAVTANSLVLAVNENTAGVVAMIAMHIADLFISPAYAQLYPSVCSETGKACAYADSDGAFDMVLAANDNDSIVIGIIDEVTGGFISDIIRRVVGEDDIGTAADGSRDCSNYDVSGAAVDVAIDPNTGNSILLKQGSETGTNQLIVGASTPVSVSIDGCFAHSMAVTTNSDADTVVVVTSKDDGILWTGSLDGTTIRNNESFELDYEPAHAKFAGLTSSVIVTLLDSGRMRIGSVSLSDGSITASTLLTVDNSQGTQTTVTGITNSVALDILTFSDGGGYLGVFLVNDGNSDSTYMAFFNARDVGLLGAFDPSNLEEYTGVVEPMDALFYVDNNEHALLAILDGGSEIIAVSTLYTEDQNMIMGNSNIDSGTLYNKEIYAYDDSNATYFLTGSNNTSIPVAKIAVTDKFAISAGTVRKMVGATSDGRIWQATLTNANQDQAGTTGTAQTLSDGNSFVNIDINSEFEAMFVVDATNERVVNGSTLLW